MIPSIRNSSQMNPHIALIMMLASTSEPTTAIRVDQIAYPTAATKLAMVVSNPAAERFSVHRLADGAKVLQGSLSPPALDNDSGDRIQIADFSHLTEGGRYEIRVAGVGRSWPFEISGAPYERLLRLATRSYYGQRCGTAVDLGQGYAHPSCHRSGRFHATSGRSGARQPPRGWHDAGDYGRYVTNSGITTATLLWAWELFPAAFSRLDLDIPKSSNGTPDFLDEIRWNLEWMLSMQDDDGGVWHKQTSEEFPPFVMPPQDDKLESFVIGTGSAPFKSSCATANLAAVGAIAARVYKTFDGELARRSLTASRRAWSWLDQHPNVPFKNPAGIKTGEYGDTDCRDERLWAAAELWRSSGEASAHEYFVKNADEASNVVSSASPPSWSELGPFAAWTWALAGKGEEEIAASIRRRSLAAADQIVARSRAHPYRIPLTPHDYVWGSNAVASNYALQLLVANEMRSDDRYVAAAIEILHYLLGRNTFSLSWVTGTGSKSVLHPHHRPSGSDKLEAPWPGLLAGGPNSARQDEALKELPADLPPARVYVDDERSYASNEVAINWNAPLVFVLAGCSEAEQ